MSVSTAPVHRELPGPWAVESVLPVLRIVRRGRSGIATHQVFEDLFWLPAAERTIETDRDLVAGLAQASTDLQSPPRR
jgi:hypothetical protein